MPTGYTADVADGKITELSEWVWQCARGMGALIMMRDEPYGTPIPERFEPSDYHGKALAEAQAALAEFRAMGPAEWQAAADADLAARVARFEEWAVDKRIRRGRYNAMIKKVKAWKNPPEGIKDFMLEQLHRGRDFDCPESDRWYESLDTLTGEEWKAEREEKLTRATAYHATELQKEIDRTEGRNAWLAHLRASLPEPPEQKP